MPENISRPAGLISPLNCFADQTTFFLNEISYSKKKAGCLMSDKKPLLQIVWGSALLLAGIGVFYRIPQVMPMIEEFKKNSFELGFKKFCFYLLAVLLVGGGIKKILKYCKYYKEKKD